MVHSRQWRIDHPDEYRQYLKNWRKNNPKKQAEYRKRHNTPESQRRRKYKSKYGITIDRYDEILKKQNGLCAICRGPYIGKGKYFHVDHDHATSDVRGLLCSKCNILIGQAKESEDILQRAISYLREFNA
jgi:hypothetical protein